MKVFYLKFHKTDFQTTLSNQWQTPVIDLYNNSQYKNYSTVKSLYGKQITGTEWASGQRYVWTGLASSDGLLTNDSPARYIDYTGPLNIVGYDLVTSSPYLGNSTVDVIQGLSSSDFPNQTYTSTGYTQSGEINISNADRYVQFNLNFDVYPGNDAIFYVRVEIGPPVIDPKYKFTQQILNTFPRWMAVREYEQSISLQAAATPQLATPTSLGGSLINAVAGEWMEDLQSRLQTESYDQYIDTVNTNTMAWCYLTTGVPQFIYSIIGDGKAVGIVWDISEFYESASTEYVAFWDEDHQRLYCNQLYGQLLINGTQYSQQLEQVWNALDDIGLRVDLLRLAGESNTSFQSRIKDVFINPLGVGSDSFKLALRRELDIWSVYDSTPDSRYLGATPEILEISDIEQDSSYVTLNGLPTPKFVKFVQDLAKQYPSTWGYFKWDQMLWDMAGPEYEGYKVLPKEYDATPLTDVNTQYGVGGGDDLLVLRPDEPTGPHNFNATISVRGKRKFTQTQYPPTDLTISVQGSGVRDVYHNPPANVWFTVIIVPTALATPALTNPQFYSFQLSSTSDVDAFRLSPSPASYATLELINSSGYVNPSFVFQDTLTGAYANQVFNAADITELYIVLGQWEYSAQQYENVTATDIFSAWFSNNPNIILNAGDNSYSSPVLLITSNGSVLPRIALMMSSKRISSSSGVWTSDPVKIDVTVNDAPNIMHQQSTAVQIPNINWDPNIIGGQEYIVSLVSNNGAAFPAYGAIVQNYDGTSAFIDKSYVYLNGSNAWNINQQIIAYGTTSITFTLGSGSLYPITGTTWELYTAPDTVFYSGIVDENGPWRNGVAQPAGEVIQSAWFTAQLGRANFGVPQSSDYIINWIGITTDDGEVIAWMESNTIQETYDKQVQEYLFPAFPIFVRLMPQTSPQWYPQIHAGTFFEGQQEYYLYATPSEETSSSATAILTTVARQGAPIIVRTSAATPVYLRQVCFFDDSATPDPGTPTTLSLVNTEYVVGTGTNILFASYPNIYNIAVQDVTIPTQPVSVSLQHTSVPSNIISTSSTTLASNTYKLSYTLAHSFYADNAYIGTDNQQHTFLAFDATPTSPDHYIIDYETGLLTFATPVPVAINPLYTDIEEGFIFLSHNEYPFSQIVTAINPSKIVANGRDYLLLTVQTVDNNDNPKPNQVLNISTSYGTLSRNTITTDKDGFGSITLIATNSQPVGDIDPLTLLPRGTITITSSGGATPISTQVKFLVESPLIAPYSIYAITANEEIPADSISQNIVYGRVFDSNFNPVAYAQVNWAKARSNFELFELTPVASGSVLTDQNGVFTIGPFPSYPIPGYWFISLESDSATPASPSIPYGYSEIGDMVFWYEYPASAFGIDNLNGLPPIPTQMATPIGYIPPYSYGYYYPVNYDQTVPNPTSPIVMPTAPPNPAPFPNTQPPPPYPPPYQNPSNTDGVPAVNWIPPQWYALPKYLQYQLGLLYLGEEHPSKGDG